MKLSIIIITYDEEKHLPRLLNSIKRQNFHDYEVIVADNNSKDNTVKIAKKYGCRITKGGKPATGRNNGAKLAKGNLLLFLDADTKLPKDFLKKNINEFLKRNLKAATCRLMADSKSISETIIYKTWNLLVSLSQIIIPHFYGACIFCRKDFFNQLNGFDQNIKVAEDNDFARRASKIGKVGILNSKKIFLSNRRLKEEGIVKLIFKYTMIELHRYLMGEIKTNKFKYKFNYSK